MFINNNSKFKFSNKYNKKDILLFQEIKVEIAYRQ